MNVTEPVRVPAALEVTVAVAVIDCPKTEGVADVAIAVAVDATRTT
jgi:hypothetical protein